MLKAVAVRDLYRANVHRDTVKVVFERSVTITSTKGCLEKEACFPRPSGVQERRPFMLAHRKASGIRLSEHLNHLCIATGVISTEKEF